MNIDERASVLRQSLIAVFILPCLLSIDDPLAQPLTPTLQVQGRNILDRCGQPLIIRGLEQVIRADTTMNNQWAPIMDQIALTGANAVRLVNDDASVSQLNTIIARAVSLGLVVYLTSGMPDIGDPAMRQMLAQYRGWLVLDVGEPGYEDPIRWRNESIAHVQFLRSVGYEEPICLMTDLYGRNLPAALQYGPAVAAADPLGRVIIGWQAYWGSNTNWYQTIYGMTFSQAVSQILQQNFPIQLGITYDADDPPDPIDYSQLMALSNQHGLPTMWWNYYNRNPLDRNDLSLDGTTTNLTPLGTTVLNTDPNSFSNTLIRKACTSQTSLPVVSISAVDPHAEESTLDRGRFRISRNTTVGNLTVTLARSGNATNASDYQSLSLTKTISSPNTFVEFDLIPINDTLNEGTEHAVISLVANAAYAIHPNSSSATVAIQDNDACEADMDLNSVLNANDYIAYIGLYAAHHSRADLDANASFNANDFSRLGILYAAGCP